MLNPIASEAVYSAAYVDNYIDSVENLPDDVQRHLSRIRDIDVQYRGHIRDVDRYYNMCKSLPNTENARRERFLIRIQTNLIHAQELSDEKMQIVYQLQELIDHKTRQLDSDQTNLDIKEEQHAAQHQQGIREDLLYGGVNQKVSRSQSPIGGASALVSVTSGSSAVNVGISPTVIGKENSNAFASVSSLVHVGANGAASADRTNGANPAIATGGNVNMNYNSSNPNVSSSISSNSITSSGDGRSSSKRSRRQRNDVNTNAMELGGNESNSANEGGGSGDRGCVTGGTVNKQTSSNQSSMVGAQKKSNQGTSGSANASGAGTSGNAATAGKKKRRKARGGQTSNTQVNAREDTPPVDPIDPDEPTYCLCDQISFGEMILCDNDLCPIEWFHFSCVSLVLKPKGKWYCPNCRGDRPNLMKPKAQFLKELERYNKEKEEKT